MRKIFQANLLRRFVRTALRVVMSCYDFFWVVTSGYGWFLVVTGGYRLVMGSYMALRVFFGGYGLLFGGKGW